MWKSIISTISNLIKILGDVCKILINNNIFQILLATVLFTITWNLICFLLKDIGIKNKFFKGIYPIKKVNRK